MSKYGFLLTSKFSYKDRIVDIPENMGQAKPVFWHILRSERIETCHSYTLLRSQQLLLQQEIEIYFVF